VRKKEVNFILSLLHKFITHRTGKIYLLFRTRYSLYFFKSLMSLFMYVYRWLKHAEELLELQILYWLTLSTAHFDNGWKMVVLFFQTLDSFLYFYLVWYSTCIGEHEFYVCIQTFRHLNCLLEKGKQRERPFTVVACDYSKVFSLPFNYV